MSKKKRILIIGRLQKEESVVAENCNRMKIIDESKIYTYYKIYSRVRKGQTAEKKWIGWLIVQNVMNNIEKWRMKVKAPKKEVSVTCFHTFLLLPLISTFKSLQTVVHPSCKLCTRYILILCKTLNASFQTVIFRMKESKP